MKRHSSIFPCLFLASALSAAPLSPGWLANPPPEDPVPEDCECRCGCSFAYDREKGTFERVAAMEGVCRPLFVKFNTRKGQLG
jgi:hypothetical protein